MKNGEKIYRLKAEWPTRCKECRAYIPVGGTFLLDLIPYWQASTWVHLSRRFINTFYVKIVGEDRQTS